MPKLLLAASTGGHLAQLVRLAHRFKASEDSLWITFDSEQSRKLLEGKRVKFVDYIPPRGLLKAIGAAREVRAIIAAEKFDAAYSTGAALALAVLPLARLAKIPSTYIESVSRFHGPSLSGRLLAASHMVTLYTQHQRWAGGRWRKIDSVLSEYHVNRADFEKKNLRIFVTLGTIRPYRFDSLVEKINSIILDTDAIVWQLGETTRADLQGTVHAYLNGEEFERIVEESDVVVTHAGVGTILNLLELGKFPVAVPRRKVLNEHVDDHQLQICEFIEQTGVGRALEVNQLTRETLLIAASRSIDYV